MVDQVGVVVLTPGDARRDRLSNVRGDRPIVVGRGGR